MAAKKKSRHIFLISKMLCNFLLQLSMAKHRHIYLVLWVLKPRKKNWPKTTFTLTHSFQKVIRALTFIGCEKFGNHVSSKFLV